MGMLDGKTAVVTGAGRGIGRGIALAFARAGARVVVNDLGSSIAGDGSERGPADEIVAEITKAGGEAVANYGSVVDFGAAGAMIEQAVSTWGRLDILVNVAGNLRDRMIFNMSEEDWDAVIAVHLKGTFNTMRAASVLMRERRSGRIINMSSVSALGSPGQPNYAAAKNGIIGLTWSSANALARYGVTVNAVMPSGATRMADTTPRAREVFEKTGKWPSELAAGTDRDPDNVAPLVVYLASDAAANVNGQVFHARGYRYTILAQPRAARAIRAGHRWNPEELAEVFPKTLGRELEPPPSIEFGTRLDSVPDTEWESVGQDHELWTPPHERG
ncbi:MAG: SDR family oxidoreductase [Candidatus Rokubacteria bacterium]|nr:SDR family oxidoreductase [Candidatus Rokubacteria bacterium]